jgi:cystathionine gamma-synthase
MRGGGGMVSFVVEGGRQAASRVVDACDLAKIAVSFGGAETLIDQPAIMSYHELSEEELRRIEIDPALIRLSVGIEETEDVVRSVLSALDA